jgi:hypothetical protein
MMNRRDALLLVERLKRRTRDSDVLTLCEYVVHLVPGVHGTSGGRDGAEEKMAPFGRRDKGRLRAGPFHQLGICLDERLLVFFRHALLKSV